jgi:hypothetical protein
MKLPSLKNDVEHLDRIWKRATKKSKKSAKRSESVRILHNTDCDSDNFSINSEISAAFDLDSPSLQNKNHFPSSNVSTEHHANNGFDRRSALKKKPSEEEPIPEVDDSSEVDASSEADPIPELNTDSLSDTPLDSEVADDNVCDEEEALVLTFKTEISKNTEVDASVDSDIENIASDEDANEPVEFSTGADPALGRLTNLLLNSQFYPATILCLVYIIACLVHFLPYYVTIPCSVLLTVLGYFNFPGHNVDSQKKLA